MEGNMRKAGKQGFISHAHEDKKVAVRLEKDLAKNNIDVWIDHTELRAGQVLLDEIQTAIANAKTFILLWSKSASQSRWVSAEWYAAWNLEKQIIPCALDKKPVPPFLLGSLSCNFTGAYAKGLSELVTALQSPKKSSPRKLQKQRIYTFQGDISVFQDLDTEEANESNNMNAVQDAIYAGQESLLNALDAGQLKEAKLQQGALDTIVKKALKEGPDKAELLSLAAYHKKNAFQIKHWHELQTGQYPPDPLLGEAETLFYKSLAIEPDNPSAVNGLGSVLILRGDLDAADFFVRRAIALANLRGISYSAAKSDLATIQMMKKKADMKDQ